MQANQRLMPAAVVLTWVAAGGLHAAESVDLKVTRVALFSSGVGFFQREATVTDSVTAQLQFRTEQINDILKSLVVQDRDGGTVGVVSYASQDPIEKTLASFGVNLTGNPTLAKILGQLRGEVVEIAGPRQLKGTIIGVETHEIVDKEQKTKIEFLNVLTETGLQQLRLGELTGIRLANEKVSAELNKALAALAGGHDKDRKSVVIHFDGKGERHVSASFLLEAPIWKTSYRLVLGADKKPFLQGWAIVENATQEDWKDVRLSLISGRPISFTMDLYTPLYVPRPQEEMELYASLRPPSYAGGMGGGGGIGGGVSAGESTMKEAQKDFGRRAFAKALKAPAASPALQPSGAALIVKRDMSEMGDSVRSVATAQEAGELYEYVIQTPVTLARQNSAMLPIVNQDISGEKVSIYNPATHPKYPLNGLMLENTSGLHLTQGPVTVFDGNVYAGDAKLPDLRAGEKRLLAYAMDLGMEVIVDTKSQGNQLERVKIDRGTFWHTRRYADERVYQIKNKDQKDRKLLIEQPYATDWKLIEPKEPFERTENLLRFKVAVPAAKTVSYPVRLEHVADESIALTNLDDNNIQIYIRQTVISKAVKEALQKVVALRAEVEQAARVRAQRETELKEATDEQGRIRENIKSLDHSTDAYTRQLKKFDALETKIESARERLDTARKEEEAKRAALNDFLSNLTVE